MHMVGHPADAVQFAVIAIDDAIHICIQFILMLFGNSQLAAVCTQDDMIQCADITHAPITLVVCLYCVASLSGRPTGHHAAITALRPGLIPCYAYRVPVGTPYRHHAAVTALRYRLVPCFAYRVPVGTPYQLSY